MAKAAFRSLAVSPDMSCPPGALIIDPPEGWAALVGQAARECAAALDDDEHVFRPGGETQSSDAARRLGKPLQFGAVRDLTAAALELLQRDVFGGPAAIDKINVFRQLPSDEPPVRGQSWDWHADGHPREFVKIQIYLCPVTAESSFFQTFWSATTARPLRIPAQPMVDGNWSEGAARQGTFFDEQQLLREADSLGFEPFSYFGPQGAFVIFNTNVVHRGTVGRSKVRDSMILRARPSSRSKMPDAAAEIANTRVVMRGAF